MFGGSLGAQAMNERFPEALKQLNVTLNVYHQCGQNHADSTWARYTNKTDSLTVEVQPFIEDMAQAYSDADLIICRAGALTVTFFFQAEDGIRDGRVTGVQTCALPIFKASKCLLKRVPLPEHDRPAQPDLEHAQGERPEHRRLLIGPSAPDLVVIPADGGKIGRASCRERV